MTAGERISRARQRASQSVKELAARLGIPEITLELIESDRRQATPSLLKEIAALTGSSYAVLLSGEIKPIPTTVRRAVEQDRTILKTIDGSTYVFKTDAPPVRGRYALIREPSGLIVRMLEEGYDAGSIAAVAVQKIDKVK